MVLTGLVDTDDEKPFQEKTREWIKRRSESDYLQNVFQELKDEYWMGFTDMFSISVTDYKFLLLSQTSWPILSFSCFSLSFICALKACPFAGHVSSFSLLMMFVL